MASLTVDPSPSARTSMTHIDPLPSPESSTIPHELPSQPTPSQPADIPAPVPPPPPQTPQIYLTFLVISGQRRTMAFEPDTTLGRVKELIWNAWPSDWEGDRPLAPSYLRVLYLGKILQDDDTLIQLKFPVHTFHLPPPTGTIVHLSVRPFAPQAEDIKKKRNRTRSLDDGANSSNDVDEANTGCCGCIIC